MLTIPIETLAYIVTKAREFDAEVPPVDEDSGSNPSDDADRDVLEASADNPTRQELADAIDGLGDPERIELLALTWLGRGDYSKEEWREAQNCGFILSADGNEIYFHRNSVTNGGFEKLALGDEVRFVAQHSESAEGPQASTVVALGKHHLPPTAAVRA